MACLFDMDRLFEDFVVASLREALSLTEWSFPRASAGHQMTLDQAGALSLEPDLSWWDGGRCTFVGDVKYKRTTFGEHADLYQLLAYATAAQLPGGLLVYAAGDDPSAPDAAHDVDGKTLHVAALDLALPPNQLLSQVALLAQRIKRMRSLARAGAVA
jgi:5-methylcytosine-specific restriction enzyme subunit McrC